MFVFSYTTLKQAKPMNVIVNFQSRPRRYKCTLNRNVIDYATDCVITNDILQLGLIIIVSQKEQ